VTEQDAKSAAIQNRSEPCLNSNAVTCGHAEPLSRKSTSANPRCNADAPFSHGPCWSLRLPGTSRAFTRSVVVQRRSLVWPVTSSARGGSFLARPGTCRASPAAPLGVPYPPVGCSLCHRSFVAFASLMPAAAANPCVPVVPPCTPGRARPRGCGGAAAP